jgi:rhamnulokinase
MVNEYTIASTSQMLHADTREWSDELFEKLDLPRKLMNDIVYPGTVIGQLSPAICEELGCSPIDVMAVGSHDTASALAAVPATNDKNWAFLSSGTWSLMGMEIDQALFTEEAFKNSFTNEGAVGGKIRFLKNITGLWILQQLMHEWRKMERSTEFGTMISDAESVPQQAVIDVDAPDFQNPVSMMEAIGNYCKNTNQTAPETNGEYMRCIVDSLSVKYGEVAENMLACTGKKIERLHIIGGGCQNALLNQLTANVLNAEVVAGPIEATALGNIMVQAIAKGEIESLEVGRNMIKSSEKLKVFYPNK